MDRFDQQTSALNIVPVKPGTPVAEVALTPSPGVSLPAGNPYAGNYAGILRDTTANTSGALAIVISASGAVWGQEITNVNGNFSSYTISGTMSASGALNVTLLEVQQTITGTVSRATNVYGPVQFGNGDAGNLVFYPFASPFGPPPPRQ
jgi:hypothetical protein